MTRIDLLAGALLWCLGVAFTPPPTLAQRSNDDLSTDSLEQLTEIHIRVSSFNNNNRIQSASSGSPSFVITPYPHIEEPLSYTNGFRARTSGVEATASWNPLPSLSFQASYTWMQAHTTQTEPGQIAIIDAWSSHRNNFSASASWSFAPHWSENSFVSFVDDLSPKQDANSVPSYIRLVLNLTREVGRSLEFSVGETNLLTPRHFEFGDQTSFIVPSQVPRNAFVKATWTL